MTSTKLSAKARRAIRTYGQDACLDAFRRHVQEFSGSSTIGFEMGLTTRQADAAINAGREIRALDQGQWEMFLKNRVAARLLHAKTVQELIASSAK